jgi:hypothetical protein
MKVHCVPFSVVAISCVRSLSLVGAVLSGMIVARSHLAIAADNQETTSSPEEMPNTLTNGERQSGWKLLFDGKTTDGWDTYKKDEVSPGWKVIDGNLVCADPHLAGDLVTKDKYDWFELSLDYNISVGGNSGVMFHVTDAGPKVWTTGPEVQLLDNVKGADPHLSGWLYDIYQPPDDPTTGKPLDATKAAGQWNTLRLLLTPEKCETDMNGTKYYEFVLGSPEWNERVAKSKFAAMLDFAKSNNGYIALQGDHGQVSFRNIKIRPIEVK